MRESQGRNPIGKALVSLIQVRNIQKPYTFEDDLLVYSIKSFFLKVTFIYRKTLLCFSTLSFFKAISYSISETI